MSLAPFIERAGDAAVPLLVGAGRELFLRRLNETVVGLVCALTTADAPKREGYFLAVNLAARLYPRLALDAPADVREEAEELARAINPAVELIGEMSEATVSLHFGGPPPAHGVLVDALGWHALVDRDDISPGPAAAPAALAAATLGAAELFRMVFAPELGSKGRTGPRPGAFNLVTLEPWSDCDLPLTDLIDIGAAHLAGCGAVGEAAAQTLAVHPTKGTLYAVDDEPTELSNAQRYVAMLDSDIGASKPALITRTLKDSAVNVVEVDARWGEHADASPGVETVLTALDTLAGRIEVQAGLPRVIYNAWTQPGDLGWSRHERFGEDQCLACLCWPRGKRPDRYRLIAEALGQHPLRVSTYLGTKQPVGQPLIQVQGTLRHQVPAEAEQWTQRSLLDDVLAARDLAPGADATAWAGRTLEELYREGVCGGGLLRPEGIGDRELTVPLAHQSALAGVMLATQVLVANHEQLRIARPDATEARFDVTAGCDQVLPRPAIRRDDCICGDADYRAAYRARHESASK